MHDDRRALERARRSRIDSAVCRINAMNIVGRNAQERGGL
jgi:hypothetical protein